MAFIKSAAGIPPNLSSQEFNDVDDSVLGIVALLWSVTWTKSFKIQYGRFIGTFERFLYDIRSCCGNDAYQTWKNKISTKSEKYCLYWYYLFPYIICQRKQDQNTREIPDSCKNLVESCLCVLATVYSLQLIDTTVINNSYWLQY